MYLSSIAMPVTELVCPVTLFLILPFKLFQTLTVVSHDAANKRKHLVSLPIAIWSTLPTGDRMFERTSVWEYVVVLKKQNFSHGELWFILLLKFQHLV